MKINVIIQLKSVIERAPECTAKLSKSFRIFFCETMILYITMFGRVNYTAMSSYLNVDLGIVKYHFEVGAGRENFSWLE